MYFRSIIFFLIMMTHYTHSGRAQTHFSLTSHTGSNAIIGVPVTAMISIYGEPLNAGDEIGVFADGVKMSDSLCVGAAVWTGASLAIVVWGDDSQTIERDGIRDGAAMYFHIWRRTTNTEYRNIVPAFSQGNRIYSTNAVYMISSLSKQSHFRFTADTGNNATVGIPGTATIHIAGNTLDVGDEIAVFADGLVTPDSFCVGAIIWEGTSAALTVWGDDAQTAALDGIRIGTEMKYHIWRDEENREYRPVGVTYDQGDGIYTADGIYILHSASYTPVSEDHFTATGYALYQNYPNPFNPSTTIEYTLARPSMVTLKIYNVLGQEIEGLVDEFSSAGRHRVRFDAQRHADGFYFYQLQTEEYTATRSMMMIK